LLEKEKAKRLLIWKCHHSFCDGVSIMSMTLAKSEENNRSYFIASKDAKIIQ
jgi:hypothetical protein